MNYGFNTEADLEHFRIFSGENTYEEISESYTFYNTSVNMTKSGLYVFNPLHNRKVLKLQNKSVSVMQMGKIQVIQVIKYDDHNTLVKTYVNVHNQNSQKFDHLMMQVQYGSDKVHEVTMNIVRGAKKTSSVASAYVDDSMKLVQRPIYDPTVELPVNKSEIIGLFTYPCVQGGLLREQYHKNFNDKAEYFLGWSNSHPIG